MPFTPPPTLMAVVMAFMGVAHFINAPLFTSIMPDYLPHHLALVYVSGLCEIVLAAMLLSQRTRALAGWGLMALYVAVFPANVHFALHPDLPLVGLPSWMPRPSPLLAWLRLPFQALFVYWAYAYTRTTRMERALAS